MEGKDEKPLLILENCPPIDYLIIGFTQTDVAMIAVCAVIGIILAIAIYAYNGNSILGVAVFFMITIMAISIFRRNQYTENLIDKLRIIWTYQKEQKIYEYEYVNIWELEREKGDATRRKKINR